VHNAETDAQKFRDSPQFVWRVPGLWGVNVDLAVTVYKNFADWK